MLQPALACPPPETDAETHLRLMAETGTVVQPLVIGDLAPTINAHVRPFLPCVISQLMVATDPPGIPFPGLLARNGIVLGVARNSLTRVKPKGRSF
jgi:hypothetical protein